MTVNLYKAPSTIAYIATALPIVGEAAECVLIGQIGELSMDSPLEAINSKRNVYLLGLVRSFLSHGAWAVASVAQPQLVHPWVSINVLVFTGFNTALTPHVVT